MKLISHVMKYLIHKTKTSDPRKADMSLLAIIKMWLLHLMFFKSKQTASWKFDRRAVSSFFEKYLQTFIDNLPLTEIYSTWFQQDGFPAHNSRILSKYLNERFQDKWIGTYTLNSRPPSARSKAVELSFRVIFAKWSCAIQLLFWDTQQSKVT